MKIPLAALLPTLLSAILLASSLSGCTATATTFGYSPYLEPIPGSITYGGQPRTRLTKAPIGSIVPHQFNDRAGRTVYETYVIEPDRSLRLVSRRYRYDFFNFD
ncbi:hypothetical protein ILFOPFJJ_04939 [Ensifer psoraleae]|nr:hypothetical protein [Sinorhizobium psoraleae]